MTTDKNDEGNWLVAIRANGWFITVKTVQAENVARSLAERIALGQVDWRADTDLDSPPELMDAVFVYERKGTVKAEQVAKWL